MVISTMEETTKWEKGDNGRMRRVESKNKVMEALTEEIFQHRTHRRRGNKGFRYLREELSKQKDKQGQMLWDYSMLEISGGINSKEHTQQGQKGRKGEQ